MIEAERFGFDFNVYPGKQYPKQVITYHIPYSGNSDLLNFRPGQYYDPMPEVSLHEKSIDFDVVNFYDDPEKVRQQADGYITQIKDQYKWVENDVARFNEGLAKNALEALQKRKEVILKQNNFLSSLGVPIMKSDNVPETFSIPLIQRKIIIKPNVPTSAYAPEPMIDNELYQQITKVIDEFGKVMERQPSIYQDKDEEALRDLFLMQLAPHFDSVTGETFNKKGKTDILLRHEMNNVFVAECKIWKGDAVYQKAIDQLLSYLTWRDSKSAVIMFVKNKEITNVLNQVQSATEKHPCYVKYDGSPSEGRFDFEFHLPNDKSRSVRVTVLCFHLN